MNSAEAKDPVGGKGEGKGEGEGAADREADALVRRLGPGHRTANEVRSILEARGAAPLAGG